MKHPDNVEAGEATKIYRRICTEIINLGLRLEWEDTPQARQIYFKDKDYLRLHKKSLEKQKCFAAIAYEGSNNFDEKLPEILNFRFYKENLPIKWRIIIEQQKSPFRIFTTKQVNHKFTTYDECTRNYINDLFNDLHELMKN